MWKENSSGKGNSEGTAQAGMWMYAPLSLFLYHATKQNDLDENVPDIVKLWKQQREEAWELACMVKKKKKLLGEYISTSVVASV